jgi:hypothetical protein
MTFSQEAPDDRHDEASDVVILLRWFNDPVSLQEFRPIAYRRTFISAANF